MMSEILQSELDQDLAFEKTVIEEEEFFEKELFQDVLEMKSLKKVAETTTADINKLQGQIYQTLFNIYQQTLGINEAGGSEQDEVFAIFELFFKNYYQHFRMAMENVIAGHSPIKVAYFLGKNTDKVTAMLDQFIKELEHEVA